MACAIQAVYSLECEVPLRSPSCFPLEPRDILVGTHKYTSPLTWLCISLCTFQDSTYKKVPPATIVWMVSGASLQWLHLRSYPPQIGVHSIIDRGRTSDPLVTGWTL